MSVKYIWNEKKLRLYAILLQSVLFIKSHNRNRFTKIMKAKICRKGQLQINYKRPYNEVIKKKDSEVKGQVKLQIQFFR